MEIIYFLIPVALVMAIGFLVAFYFANKSGQFEDTVSPATRILIETISKEES